MDPGDDVSVRVLTRCGHRYEGRLRSFFARGDRRGDALVCSRVLGDSATRPGDELDYCVDEG